MEPCSSSQAANVVKQEQQPQQQPQQPTTSSSSSARTRLTSSYHRNGLPTEPDRDTETASYSGNGSLKRNRTTHPTHSPSQRARHSMSSIPILQQHTVRRPPPAVRINDYTELCDSDMLRWQEVQVSRCIIENSVNTVVEAYTDISSTETEQSDDNETMMEESGIQAAITNHGLSLVVPTVSPLRRMQNFILESTTALQAVRDMNVLSVVTGGFCANIDIDEDMEHVFGDDEDSDEEYNDLAAAAAAAAAAATANGAAAAAATSDGSTTMARTVVAQCDEESSSGAEHMHFMEAAVAVAIREKGLVTTAPDSQSNNGSAESSPVDEPAAAASSSANR